MGCGTTWFGLNLSSASLGSSIYENDIVYLVGRLDGTYTYTSTLSTNTVPVIDVTQLRLANAKPTTTTTVKPTTTPTTVAPLGAVQSPASYLLTKSNAPAGWTEQTIEGTGFPKLLSALCTPKESRAQMCATAGVRFVAKGGVQSVVEGLVNWATQTRPSTPGLSWQLHRDIHAFRLVTSARRPEPGAPREQWRRLYDVYS